NKKLHFEVAVIKAIQTLGQVTLTEVIDNLAALRGGALPAAERPQPAKAPAAKTVSAKKKFPAPKSEKPAVSAASTETVPGVSSHKDASHVPATSPAVGSLDMTEVWPKAVQLVYARRPLIKTWIELA